MKETIENVLNDETYTTNEERVEAITKGLATLVIPKNKFNDLSERLQARENEYNTLSSEFEKFKQSKMTDDEKASAAREEFEKARKENAIETSRLAVKELFLDNGIKIADDESYANIMQNVISEDKEKSLGLAQEFLNLINKTKQDTKQETTLGLLNDVPKPMVGDPSKQVSQLEALNEQYKEAVAKKDNVQIARLTRLIQEEQIKQKN